MSKILLGGITYNVPKADDEFYVRAGGKIVGQGSTVTELSKTGNTKIVDEQKAFERVAVAEDTRELYAVQREYPDRSEALEEAINAKGRELTEKEELARIAAENAKQPEVVTKSEGGG